MPLFNAITQSQSLVQEITAKIDVKNQTDILALLTTLETELDKIHTLSHSLNEKSSLKIKPEMKSGCYIFTNKKGFFCPHCYDNNDQKIATKRMNSKLRVCPLCHSSIKA